MTDEPTDAPTPPPPGGSPETPGTEGTLPPPAAAEARTEPLASIPVDEPTQAAPVGPPPSAPTTEAAEVTTTTTTETPRRTGVFVPVWALVTVVGLLLLAAGGIAGYAIGSHDDGGGRTVRAGGFRLPERIVPPGFGQVPDGNGNSNGNGNGNSNGNGDGNGGSTTDNGAFLGVAVQNSTDPRGAELVRVVASSPAADAGLKTGDVITAVDGKDVTGAASLTTQVRAHSSGDDVQITYRRGDASSTVKVTLGDRTPTSTQ